MNGPMVFLFPLVLIAIVFTFTAIVHSVDSSRKEREAYYRADTLKRLADSPGDGAKTALDLLREQDRLRRIKAREGMKLGGVINICIGFGLSAFLYFMLGSGHGSPALVGLLPGMIGVGLLVYVYFLADPIP